MFDSFLQFNNLSFCFVNFYVIMWEPHVNDCKVSSETGAKRHEHEAAVNSFAYKTQKPTQ